MFQTIDWATKKAQGRVKDIGVAWTEEELILLRDGKATVEELRAADASSKPAGAKAPKAKKPIEKLNKTELRAKVAELGLTDVPEDATNAELVEAIKGATK